MTLTFSIISLLFFIKIPVALSATAEFPGKTPGLKISSYLKSNFEPSGGAWHSRLKNLFVVSDSGFLAQMSSTGSYTRTWKISGNWEGVAIADPASNFVYLLDEGAAVVREFDYTKSLLSSRVFKLTTAKPETGVAALTSADIDALKDSGDGTGGEALCFVPDEKDKEGGLFFVGSQENGYIYKFRFSLSSGSLVTYMGKFRNWTDKDLAGLEYDWQKGTLLAVWDNENKIRALDLNGRILHEWKTPPKSKGEEGVSYNGSELFISEDQKQANRQVLRYDAFYY